uniref:Uncharacterized protein n=1 Tax=Fundulus heteroclitus TaxID=8078 RepID=A0A3Q2TF54_FUNHE
MVWGCFGAGKVADLSRVKGILNKESYQSILQRHAVPSGQRLIGANFIVQQDNDPEHTSRLCRSRHAAAVPAIDSKIEQAMDLAKTHLMLAVRDEVELLREQIRDLQEKNQQLETENRALKQRHYAAE